MPLDLSFSNPPTTQVPHEYAAFLMRFAAFLLDYVLLSICSSILGFIFGFVFGFTMAVMQIHAIAGFSIPDAGGILGAIIGLTMGILYDAILTASSWHATFGKKILNVEVQTVHGQYLTFGRSLGRAFLKLFLGCGTLYIGFIIAAFTEKRQSLHDILAGTVVVMKK